MSKRRSRDHNEDAEWRCHKETIRQLYITENKALEGSDSVVEKMKVLYGFNKTPRQYHVHLKQWGFRKNRRGLEWGTIGRKIAARKRAGKETVVYLEGKILPKQRVDKQTYRNGYDAAFRQCNQGSMPTTPEGFTLLTPPAEDRELFQIFNLPFMDFQAATLLKGIDFTISTNRQNIHDIHLSPHASPYPHPLPHESRTSSEQIAFHDSSQITELHKNTAKMHYSIVVPTLRSLLPTMAIEDLSDNGSKKLLPIAKLRGAHLKLLCFSVANNFAGVTGLSLKLIWEYVRNQISMPQLMELATGPTSKALAEKLFTCAIESGDVPAVEYLLQKRYVDVNNHVCIIEDIRYSPIERCAMLRDVPMTKILIKYNADVNKTYAQYEYQVRGSLEYTIRSFGCLVPVDPVLVQVLLDSGAVCSLESLKDVICQGDARVAEIILLKHGPGSYKAFLENGVLHDAVNYLDNKLAMSIVQNIALPGADINYCLKICEYNRHPKTLLDTAVRRGSLDLVQILLGYGACLTEDTLTCAIQSENMDLVLYLLNKGAKIDSCVCIGDYSYTPYSEAIRYANFDLIQLLQHGGCLDRITEEKRFKAAVCAASKVGNIKILQTLIEVRADEREISLGCALMGATLKGQGEVALLLIDAGALIRHTSHKSFDIVKVLPRSLKRRMNSLFYAILKIYIDLESNFHTTATSTLNTAIKLGDHSIVEDLIFASAHVNSEKSSLEYEAPLSVAGRKNDIELIRLLLAEGADVNSPASRNNTALAAAVGNGDVKLIRFLLEENADPGDEIALLEAMSKCDNLVQLLLAKFTERYPRGKRGFGSEALYEAIKEDKGPLFKALLKVSADTSKICWRGETGKTPLALAIEKKNLAIIQRLLEEELDLNNIISITRSWSYLNTGPPRLTALLVAVCTKDPQIIQLLIKKGANVNLPATRGVQHTPIQMAAKIGSLEIIQILIKNGADINAQPAYSGGATALQYAAIGGFIGIAEELLKRGADVNAPAAKVHGRTALEGAIEHGRIDMVQFLLNAHAEFKGLSDQKYERAIRYARGNGHWALLEMLESYSQSEQNRRAGYIHGEEPEDVAEAGKW